MCVAVHRPFTEPMRSYDWVAKGQTESLFLKILQSPTKTAIYPYDDQDVAAKP